MLIEEDPVINHRSHEGDKIRSHDITHVTDRGLYR